jgi:hypothetical protein
LPGIRTARNVMKLGWNENYYEFNPLTLRAAGLTSDETSCHGTHDLYQQMPGWRAGIEVVAKANESSSVCAQICDGEAKRGRYPELK